MFILRRISMKRVIWSAGILAAVAALAVRPLTGQGVTSAAIAGRLTDDAGAAVTSALVTLTNASTGQRYSTRSSEDGRYFFENVQVGGPYTLDVRARSEEHTSELQSLAYLVCRLLLEKKKKINHTYCPK